AALPVGLALLLGRLRLILRDAPTAAANAGRTLLVRRAHLARAPLGEGAAREFGRALGRIRAGAPRGGGPTRKMDRLPSEFRANGNPQGRSLRAFRCEHLAGRANRLDVVLEVAEGGTDLRAGDLDAVPSSAPLQWDRFERGRAPGLVPNDDFFRRE